MFHTLHSALCTLHLRKAFTLVEALVVMMILAIIGGAIMVFYPAAAKLFYRGAAESQAEAASSQAVRQMAPIVREAINLNVVVRDAGTGEVRLEVSLPQKQTEAMTGEDLVVYPLAVDKEIAFYRSDSSGNPDVTGDKFWQAQRIGAEWKPSELLAEGVTSFRAPTVDTVSPKGVEVVVKSRGTQGSRKADVTHREYLQCRNT